MTSPYAIAIPLLFLPFESAGEGFGHDSGNVVVAAQLPYTQLHFWQ